MPKKILLVDDSKTALMVNSAVISERTTYEISTATDGAEAVESALNIRPDLILMDVVMPKKNGFEACHELRLLPETASIPVILLTTRAEAECVENGFVSGCTEYLTKPVDADELVQILGAYLGE